MRTFMSQALMEDLTRTVRLAAQDHGFINISRLASEVRRRHERENVALEDIEARMVICAQLWNAAMEFDSATQWQDGAALNERPERAIGQPDELLAKVVN